ncbi:MAG: glycosyl hydrolase 115 family protein [Spirochaetaceae bacterium]|nr:glycosyl hydrolase 115 family protein [Spirochaetaceae bacterium]
MFIFSDVCFLSSKDDFPCMEKIASKVRHDIQLVTGNMPKACYAEVSGSQISLKNKLTSCYTIIYGTVGKSAIISALAEKGIINLDNVNGKREVYSFTVVKRTEISGLDKPALIIAGSDKRGTIYGLFHISELLGVSPLVDWAGVLPAHKDRVVLTEKDNFVSKEPSVKYRGFFINDEWPAFGNWTMHNYGGFNAKMYEHVFELLLRMKGNYLWPAMWSARFSEDGPGLLNAELADEYGVIMGASHHEPCCRNGEEYKYLRGKGSIYGDAWNFRANREGITRFWEDGLKRSGKFESVITVGMRGEADTAILGKNATLKDNIDLLRDVLKTQNGLIKKYVNADLDKVPRMLALYKEVEPYFYGDKDTKGLMGDPELDGVTLMLCEDNHGHLRTVPTEEMRNHKGGYGMYFHFDYHGWPYSYEWANTNSLPEVKEQMCAAYEFGIRELWIVNVGDIFSNEFPLSYFLNLAYDYEKYSDLDYTTEQYTKEWADFQFAALKKSERNLIASVLTRYTKLARMRRTECIKPDTFHPVNFGESDMILAEAEKIIADVERLNRALKKRLVAGKDAAASAGALFAVPESLYAGFYSQVYFPAAGTMNVLRLQLTSGKNQWYAEHSILAANPLCAKIRKYLEFDKHLVNELDTVDGGRWYAMGWSEHIGFQNWNEEDNQLPVEIKTSGANKPRIVVWLDGDSSVSIGQDWTRKILKLNAFRNPEVSEVYLNIATASALPFAFEIKTNKKWLSFDTTEGEVSAKNLLQKVTVRIDRKLLAKDGSNGETPYIGVFGKTETAPKTLVPIEVDVRPLYSANLPKGELPAGTFVQTGDYISIEAEHFVRNVAANGADITAGAGAMGAGGNAGCVGEAAAFKVLPGYGKTLSAIKVFPETAWFPTTAQAVSTASEADSSSAPFVEYVFALDEAGSMNFDFYLSPLNPVSKKNLLQFVVEVNGAKSLKDVVSPSFAVGDDQQPWGNDIVNNIRVSTVTAPCKAGLNILRIYPVTPAFVLEKIVIHAEDKPMPYSYLGAPETYRTPKK